MPQLGSDISEIKNLAGQFKGLAFIAKANQNSPPDDKPGCNRRGFLNYLAIGIGTVGVTVVGSHIAKKSPAVTWNMTTFLGETLKGKLIIYKAPQRVCDLVKLMSDGEFQINLNRR